MLGVHDVQILGVDHPGKQAGPEIKHTEIMYSYTCCMERVSKGINPSDPNIKGIVQIICCMRYLSIVVNV